ncbi:hypothetical protein PInf_002894 [Phytophthora infestans]|nr:hypothetical protein PInf_002894 [Phytophthora infestans]
METRGEIPSSDKVAKYVEVVAKYLRYLEQYRSQKLFRRLIKHQAMSGQLALIYEEIDMLFRILNLAGTAAMMEWKQQWDIDQQAQQEVMSSLVVNSVEVLRELQDTRAQLEAMMMLKGQTSETMHLMKSMMATVVRASKTTVAKLPPWFFPSDDIEFEEEPFAPCIMVCGGLVQNVVKCFLVDDVIVDGRAK